ncbi:major facilitator superfamily domain-containing protein [Coniochaeta sp. 2T2.1]|nr:major facilitator superfamily domain-containing protein [Coniochaeta sp. 2T2.1]
MVQPLMPAAEQPTEASPLLKPQDAVTSSDEQQQQPVVEDMDAGWNQDAIRALVSTTVFLILFTLADLLKYVAVIRLLELGVCREYHRIHDPSLVDDNGYVPEKLCKLAEIQQRLAHLRGYYSALDSVVGLVLTVPYGLVVGRLGERLLIAINVVGYLLSCAWFLVVCSSWDTFSTWTAVLSPLFRAIGGGSPFLFSLVYSIAAKHIPSSKRSSGFFMFLAAQTITSTFATLIAAAFLDHGFLFLPLLLNFPIGLLCIASLAFVRGTKSSGSATSGRPDVQDDDDDEHINNNNNNNNGNLDTSRSIRHSARILGEVLQNPAVLVLLATVPVAKAVNPIGELTWQYIPKKFGISFAETSRVLSIPSLECVLLLLFVLPNIKSLAQSRYHASSIKVDLYFVQYGFLIQAVGCVIMAFAQTLAVFILGILVFALGCSTRPALQSVLADLARSREHVAVLFTVIAVADLIGSAAGTILLNWAFSIALDWEMGVYLGSPFALVGGCFIAAFVASVYIGRSALHHHSGRGA